MPEPVVKVAEKTVPEPVITIAEKTAAENEVADEEPAYNRRNVNRIKKAILITALLLIVIPMCLSILLFVKVNKLEKELKDEIDGVTSLTFDFKALEYISSAGLRVLLSAQKIMNKQGSMKITNVNSEIMEIFEITGFSGILTIE